MPEPMEYQLKNQLSRRKLMASFKEALSKIILNLFLLSVQVAPNFVTAINFFPHYCKRY